MDVFDGDRLLADRDVLLSESTLIAVTAAQSALPPQDALHIAGRGTPLLPGLIHSPVHLLTAGGRPGSSICSMLRPMAQAGLPFFVCTDTGVFGVFPGAALHAEILELGKLGLPPEQILRRSELQLLKDWTPRAAVVVS